MDISLLKRSVSCKCPRCQVGDLYEKGFTLDLRDSCPECELDFTKNDSADGPAVFMIFILGFMLVPLALLFENIFMPPLWVHGVLWSVVALGVTLGVLKPLKSYIIALQYSHRPEDWE